MDTFSTPLRDEIFVAKKLHCQPKTLQSWRVRGAGPPFCKIGRLVRYRDEDVMTWLESRRANSTSE